MQRMCLSVYAMSDSVKTFLLFFICNLLLTHVTAQGSTDLYVFQLQKDNDSYHLFKPQFLSGFNPGGYTNQPWFTPEGDLLVSVRMKNEMQNDIYRLSLDDYKIRRITKTAANEYSPRMDPTQQYLSVVRQVEGGSMDQQVFLSKRSGGGYQSITPDRKDIGYYTWIDNDQLALFRIEGESNTLEKYSIIDQKARKITSAIGRSLWTDIHGAVVYVHKFSTDYWYLKKFNSDVFRMDIITQTPGMAEDFALAPDGTYFMSLAGKIFIFHPEHQITWQEIADLSIYGIEAVSRLAISPDGTRIAVVATKNNQ